MSTTLDVRLHPIATVFPEMSQEEFEGLKKDILENGQRESIIYWNHMLLDGRHRLRACRELGIEPLECELDFDSDPIAFALGCNLHRRHLDKSQLAIVVGKIAKLKKGDVASQRDVQNCTPSLEEAANSVNIGRTTAAHGKKVVNEGCEELQQLVTSGKLSVSKAAEIAAGVKCPEEQMAIAKEFIETPRKPSKKTTVSAHDVEKAIDKKLEELQSIVEGLEAMVALGIAGSVGQKLTGRLGKIQSTINRLIGEVSP